jgi:hypothetical protein
MEWLQDERWIDKERLFERLTFYASRCGGFKVESESTVLETRLQLIQVQSIRVLCSDRTLYLSISCIGPHRLLGIKGL